MLTDKSWSLLTTCFASTMRTIPWDFCTTVICMLTSTVMKYVLALMIGGHKPPDITPLWSEPPVELEHNVRCRFKLQERGFWKLNFRIGGLKPPDITPRFRTSLSSRQCDSIGIIRPCHWTWDSDLGGVMSGHYSVLLLHTDKIIVTVTSQLAKTANFSCFSSDVYMCCCILCQGTSGLWHCAVDESRVP